MKGDRRTKRGEERKVWTRRTDGLKYKNNHGKGRMQEGMEEKQKTHLK